MKPLEACQANPNMCVPWMLILGYLYYIRELPTGVSDQDFDAICKLALENWKKIRHPHKKLIKVGDLTAGTLYGITERKYPLMVRGAAMAYYDKEVLQHVG